MIATMPEILGWSLWSAVLVVSVVLRGLYAGMETGVYVLNKVRLDLRAESGDRQALMVQKLLTRPNNLLSVLLIGTNVPSYAATFAVSAMFVLAGARQWAEWYTLAVATPLLFVFGESVPKNVFRRLAETLVYALAWFLRVSVVALNACGLAPAVQAVGAVLTRLAGHRMRAYEAPAHTSVTSLLAEGRASGLLTHFQSTMADRVVHIGTVTLADVMVPMSRVIHVPSDVERTGLVERIRGHDYSRLPVLGPAGQIVGVLDIYDALMADPAASLSEKISAPLVLKVDMSVTDALYQMQREHVVLAVVADASDTHVGIVAIKDLVQEIVGELAEW